MQRSTSSIFLDLIILFPYALFVFFAFWTVGCHATVVLELSYSSLNVMLGLAVGMTVITMVRFGGYIAFAHNTHQEKNIINKVSKSLPYAMVIIIFGIYITQLYLPYMLTWLILTLLAFVFYVRSPSLGRIIEKSTFSYDWSSTKTTFSLLFLIVVTITITTIAVRPDADDAFYLGIVTQGLDSPWLPVLKFDPLYGSTEIHMPAMRMAHTYEPLVATVSRVFYIDHLTTYYIVFPAISCLVFVSIFFCLYKELLLSKAAAILAVLFLVLLLVLWGDAHRTMGNFAFVRFFQGKSLLINIFVPSMVGLLVLYFYSQELKYLVLLMFVAVGSTGLSVNALLITPITILLALVGVFISNPHSLNFKRSILSIIGITCYPIFIAILIKINPSGEVIKHFGPVNFLSQFQETTKVLGTVIGDNGLNLKSSIVLGLFACSAVLFPLGKKTRLVGGVILVYVVLLFFPGHPLQLLFAKYASMNLVWRLMWVVPLTFFAAGSLGSLASRLPRNYGVTFSLLLVSTFAIAGTSTLSKANKTKIAIQNHKFDTLDYTDAVALNKLIPPRKLLLAPEKINVVLNGLRESPPKLVVRAMYLVKFPDSKKQDYLSLLSATEFSVSPEKVNDTVRKLDHYGVKTIIFKRSQGVEKELLDLLSEANFQCNIRYKNIYTICVK